MFERIKELREEYGLTQSQIAHLLNIHQTSYSKYELGDRDIPISVLMDIADIFDTSVDYLIGKSNKRDLNNKENYRGANNE